jgi:hypothetical protein
MRRALVFLAALIVVGACSKSGGSGSATGSGSASAASPTTGYLTVGAYCDAFCDKLCATCGAGNCADSCRTRCHFGRAPEMVLDGTDPKRGLALTQQNLDACLATISSKESCLSIASGQVPPACYTIQH